MRALILGLLLWSGAAAAQSLTYPIAGSGQTQCYDLRGSVMTCARPGQPLAGQDAQAPRQAPHYRDNGDGTVADLVTGLMWERDFRKSSFAAAPQLAAGARTGGHADWRVPTIKELYSLMDFSGSTGSGRPDRTGPPPDARPYLNPAFSFEYPSQGRFIDAQYISSTAYVGKTMGGNATFFGVNFADGRIKGYPQNGGPGGRDWYLRLVRGNPQYGRNSFRDNGDGTITDAATGLGWTRGDSGDAAFTARLGATAKGDGRLDWREALAFCAGLDWAGHRDWRLPTAKELHSIVDYSRAPDVTHSAAIDPLFAITAIQDEEGKRDWPYGWTSTTHLDGRMPGDFAVYFAFGRAGGHMRLDASGRPMMGGMGGPPPRPGGGMMGPPPMMEGGGGGILTLLEVHGAGAQRSSPKSGDEAMLPKGMGPQGDVLRIYNYARCVRG